MGYLCSSSLREAEGRETQTFRQERRSEIKKARQAFEQKAKEKISKAKYDLDQSGKQKLQELEKQKQLEQDFEK